jgi:ATP-binding cassette subfamily B protein
VERDADRLAFAKACAYLNYKPTAKWSAHVAGAAAAFTYVCLLVVLWLFVDLLVSRGRLPNFSELTRDQKSHFVHTWNDLPSDKRSELLGTVIPPAKPDETEEEHKQAADLAAERLKHLNYADPEEPPSSRADLDRAWRAYLPKVLEDYRIGSPEDRAGLVTPSNFDEIDRGLLSLVVRLDASGSYLAWPMALAARLNPWTWRAWFGSVFSTYLTGLLLIGGFLVVAGVLLQLAQRESAARATIEAATRLRRAVYHHTFRLGTLAFRALGPTEAVTVFTRHVEAVHEALYARLTVFFREPIKFGLLILFALVVQPLLALAFLFSAVIVWLVGGQLAAYFRAQNKQATHEAGERLTIMRESLMLMRLVKCYLMEPFNQARVERQLSKYGQVQLSRLRGEAIYRPILIGLALLCSALLLYVTGVLILNEKLGVARVVALTVALVSLYRPVELWFDSRKVLRRGREAAAHLFRFLERRGEVGQVVGAEFLPPLSRNIEFDNVSLREPGSDRMLLEEVTLTIPSGQRVGLIGADNLEKHALVYLIPRLLDPTTGEIRIDQHNLRWVTLDSLRAQMAAVLQHNLVFHDTVANNIGCGDSAYTLPQIIEAAKIAHAHHFIQKLPQGYETPIGELGHPLSASEQFRIALARAVLRDPALLIIEEPETPLDEDMKSLLDDTMTRMLPGRTAIFLPHRISTIRSCDKLFLLHKGRVVASGVHKELLAQNPLYRHLHYLEFNEIAEQV